VIEISQYSMETKALLLSLIIAKFKIRMIIQHSKQHHTLTSSASLFSWESPINIMYMMTCFVQIDGSLYC
jgi:hypothetical protein